jgi:chaperonin GroEL
MGKHVIVGPEAREKMKIGVDILANAVKATLGPRGRNAAIERRLGPPIITKDGVTVARYIDLDDRVENMGAQLIKSVASDANNQAGDGTTTATVLAQEIYGRGLKHISNGNNPVLVKRGIDIGVAAAVKHLKSISIPVNDEKTLCQVATISANNDRELGAMIAEAVSAVGNDGLISVEEAAGNVTEVIYSDGLKLERGWLDENFVTEPARNTCEMENPYILLYDDGIESVQSLVPVLNQVIAEERPILMVVKDIKVEVLTHLVLNKLKNIIRCCVIRAPGFGDYRRAMMEDIAVITGAKLFTNADGQGLEGMKLTDLGVASTVSVGPNLTKIIGGAASQEDVDSEVELLRERMSDPAIFEHQSLVLRSRISRLTGGAAIFRVGATSEGEMREKKDRVEDAVNAVKSAIAEGVVPGGGCALLHCLRALDELDTSKMIPEEVIGIRIIKDALKAPFNQILLNAGIEEERAEYMRDIIESETFSGFDALRLELVDDMLEQGIVDPTKVVRTALEHAASASGTLLTTEVTISWEDVKEV